MKLRIHGDNIIECERTLSLIALAYSGKVVAKTKNIIHSVKALTESFFILTLVMNNK